MRGQGAAAALPSHTGLGGPRTRAKLLRLLLSYAALVAAGATLLLWSSVDALQLFGLGMLFPGAGFLAHADLCSTAGLSHLAAAGLAGVAFLAALALWFGTGNILAPPLVWLGSALWAASMRHGPVPPGVAANIFAAMALCATLAVAGLLVYQLLAQRRRRLDNAYLAAQAGRVESIFGGAPLAGEMSLEHLQRLRFALDRALQPVAQFGGFEKLDQFQTAATRYQINFLAYGIALTQARFTPAFDGYLNAAQLALLAKQAEYPVWKYWGLENLWGNLRQDPDPMARENIMYTGFVAMQMALYRASSGHSAGSIELVHPAGPRYRHDGASLIACLERDFASADYYLIACEPNWVYPLCNTIGASAMLCLDAPRWARHAAPFRQHLEAEFLDAKGRYVPCRSARTGLALPAIGGAMPLAMPCFFLNVLAPDIAKRQWLLLRRTLFDREGRFRRRAFWPIDTGNYRFTRASAYTATALAAAELGDHEVYLACMAALDDECPGELADGVIHRPRASVWAHGVELMARAGARGAFAGVLGEPYVPGIRLTGLRYPDVLVARAHADGQQLHAVLYANGIHSIGLAGLRPHGRYLINGALSIVADGQGCATADMLLSGRSECLLRLET